jgi:N-methylhydantoinase B/oxoprolinase/acetone carboxylase alpha subunit
LKKKLLVTLFSLSLLVGGTQVFAASVLNTNIIDLIKSHIFKYGNDSANDLESKLGSTDTVKKSVSAMVKQKESESQKRIDAYKEQELNNANTEINQFIKQIETEMDAQVTAEEEKAKSAIKAKKDKKVKEIQDEMLAEIEKELK